MNRMDAQNIRTLSLSPKSTILYKVLFYMMTVVSDHHKIRDYW